MCISFFKVLLLILPCVSMIIQTRAHCVCGGVLPLGKVLILALGYRWIMSYVILTDSTLKNNSYVPCEYRTLFYNFACQWFTEPCISIHIELIKNTCVCIFHIQERMCKLSFVVVFLCFVIE